MLELVVGEDGRHLGPEQQRLDGAVPVRARWRRRSRPSPRRCGWSRAARPGRTCARPAPGRSGRPASACAPAPPRRRSVLRPAPGPPGRSKRRPSCTSVPRALPLVGASSSALRLPPSPHFLVGGSLRAVAPRMQFGCKSPGQLSVAPAPAPADAAGPAPKRPSSR